MAEWIERYVSVDAKDLPRAEPKPPDFGDPVDRTQNVGLRKDRQARPLNDVLGQAHNVSYFDGAFDQKLAACTLPSLRINDLPQNVGIAFWKDAKGYFFYFQNGTDGKKPHYIPPGVNRIEVMQNGQVHAQDLAQIKPGVDQAVAREAAKPPAVVAPPGGVVPPGGIARKDTPPAAGAPKGKAPDHGIGEYAGGKPWHQPGGDVGLTPGKPVPAGINRWAQRATAGGADYFFGSMALKAAAPAGLDAAGLLAHNNKMFNGTIGALAGGELGKYLIDSQLFPNANPTGRTYIIDGLAPAVVLTKLHPLAKIGVILGAHTTARYLDSRETKR